MTWPNYSPPRNKAGWPLDQWHDPTKALLDIKQGDNLTGDMIQTTTLLDVKKGDHLTGDMAPTTALLDLKQGDHLTGQVVTLLYI